MTVRLDDPRRGEVLGTLTVPGAYSTASTALTSGHAGRHTVYLAFDNPAELHTSPQRHRASTRRHNVVDAFVSGWANCEAGVNVVHYLVPS